MNPQTATSPFMTKDIGDNTNTCWIGTPVRNFRLTRISIVSAALLKNLKILGVVGLWLIKTLDIDHLKGRIYS